MKKIETNKHQHQQQQRNNELVLLISTISNCLLNPLEVAAAAAP